MNLVSYLKCQRNIMFYTNCDLFSRLFVSIYLIKKHKLIILPSEVIKFSSTHADAYIYIYIYAMLLMTENSDCNKPITVLHQG